jgi:hypothetical protein
MHLGFIRTPPDHLIYFDPELNLIVLMELALGSTYPYYNSERDGAHTCLVPAIEPVLRHLAPESRVLDLGC